MLSIRLLGKTSILADGVHLEGQLSSKTIAMLYLLLGQPSHFLSRDKITLFLWPDSTEEAARYNLRYNLWLVKKHIPLYQGEVPLILSEKDGCRFNQNYPWTCDLTEIKQFDADSGSIAELLRVHNLFAGEIMEGWYLKNCTEFNERILFDRMICEGKHVKILQSLARRYRAAEQPRKQLEALKEIAAIEPNNEDVALEMMQAYVHLGNRAAAINYYRQFEAALWSELHIAPDEPLRQFYHQLSTDAPRQPAPDAAPAQGEPMVLAGRCMTAIPYFLLSDLVNKALRKMDHHLLLGLDAAYVRDLSIIQQELALAYEAAGGDHVAPGGPVLDVRIIQAFCRFFELLAEHYPVRLSIAHREQADPVSEAALSMLEDLNLPNLMLG